MCGFVAVTMQMERPWRNFTVSTTVKRLIWAVIAETL